MIASCTSASGVFTVAVGLLSGAGTVDYLLAPSFSKTTVPVIKDVYFLCFTMKNHYSFSAHKGEGGNGLRSSIAIVQPGCRAYNLLHILLYSLVM